MDTPVTFPYDFLGDTAADWRTLVVLPTETVSQSWMRALVERGHQKVVRKDRFISWDTFRRTYLMDEQGRTAADQLDRRLFAQWVLAENAKSPFLHELVREEFSGDSGAFTTSLVRMLPELRRFFDELGGGTGLQTVTTGPDVRDRTTRLLLSDLQVIYHRYREYLDQEGLYEPQWEPFSVERLRARFGANHPVDRIEIVFPELVQLHHVQALRGLLSGSSDDRAGASDRITSHPVPDSVPPPSIELFRDIKQEITVLFDRLEGLLGSGVDASEIAVTLGSADGWYPLMVEQAALRGIPLRWRSGRNLSEYPSARFFRDLYEVYHQDYSLTSMKRLLLQLHYPWKDRGMGRRLIAAGIACSCHKNYREQRGSRHVVHDVWEERLSRLPADRGLDILRHYRSLKVTIDGICTASSFSDLYDRMNQFRNVHLVPDAWGLPGPETSEGAAEQQSSGAELDENRAVMGYCMDMLAALRRRSEERELKFDSPAISIWLSVLNEQRYTPQRTGGGIDIYPYGLSVGILPKFHFLAGISQQAVERIDRGFSFLQEYQSSILRLEGDELDTTSEALRVYSISGEQVSFSCSVRDVDGTQLVPLWFSEHGVVREHERSGGESGAQDPYTSEQRVWAALSTEWLRSSQSQSAASSGMPLFDRVQTLYPVQYSGFRRALLSNYRSADGTTSSSSHHPRIPALHLVALQGELELIQISPTAFDRFQRCPYQWFISYGLGIDEVPFEPLFLDRRVVGELAHACLADFFTGLVGPFDMTETDLYDRQLTQILERRLHRFWYRHDTPIPPIMIQMTRLLEDVLGQVTKRETENLNGWKTIDIEQRLDLPFRDEGFILTGRLDRLAVQPESGELAIIDYKLRVRIRPSSFDTGKHEPDSYQLLIYTILVEAHAQPGSIVSYALYYDIELAKFVCVMPRSKTDRAWFEQLMQETIVKAQEMADRIRLGDISPQPTVDRCKACRERDICRERYTVR